LQEFKASLGNLAGSCLKKKKKKKKAQVQPMAHACNPGYLGGSDQAV
jgi:hypothetical protein